MVAGTGLSLFLVLLRFNSLSVVVQGEENQTSPISPTIRSFLHIEAPSAELLSGPYLKNILIQMLTQYRCDQTALMPETCMVAWDHHKSAASFCVCLRQCLLCWRRGLKGLLEKKNPPGCTSAQFLRDLTSEKGTCSFNFKTWLLVQMI